MKKGQWFAVICFGLLMACLGVNDALRGIFSPVFQERYQLDEAQLSQLLTVSYLGNLIFLSIGGMLLDKLGKRTVMGAMIVVLALSMVLNAASDQYVLILVSVFFALGASTLLNTSVNLATPLISQTYAGLLINLFFFIQGVGTSASQFFLGRYAFTYAGWRGTCTLLACLLAVCLVLFFFTPIRNNQVPRSTSGCDGEAAVAAARPAPSARTFWLFVCMMGCYFIAEHSIMNRLMSYCLNSFSMPSTKSSTILSIFWGGMTLGRLVFAPVVQRFGCRKSIMVFGGIGVTLFSLGCFLGQPGVYMLSLSGLAISILYPTMLLLLQELYPASCVAAKTGTIISLATIADIGFNVCFGFILTQVGYRMGFLLLPCFFIAFYILYIVIHRTTRVWGKQ